jgi:hypothetical protein
MVGSLKARAMKEPFSLFLHRQSALPGKHELLCLRWPRGSYGSRSLTRTVLRLKYKEWGGQKHAMTGKLWLAAIPASPEVLLGYESGLRH